MSGDDEVQAAADALSGGVVVSATGSLVEAVTRRATATGVASASGPSDLDGSASALVVAIADTSPETLSELARQAGRVDGLVVGVLAAPDGDVDRSTLTSIREAVDAVLFVPSAAAAVSATLESPGDGVTVDDPAVEGAFAFVRMLRGPGYVNIDLADARTVLTGRPLAVFGCGVAESTTPDPSVAVADAFRGVPEAIDPAGASGALVNVAVPSGTTLEDAIAAVRAVRERISEDAHIIWGSTAEAARLSVRVVLAGVAYERLVSAGDPCPRCDAPLRSFVLGDSETLLCGACGFADLSMSLE